MLGSNTEDIFAGIRSLFLLIIILTRSPMRIGGRILSRVARNILPMLALLNDWVAFCVTHVVELLMVTPLPGMVSRNA